jgi:hypothetical protein
MTRDKIKNPTSSGSEGSEITTIEKNETKSKGATYDITKADSISAGITDILDSPDVAVWSKGIMKKTNTPSGKVQEPSHVKLTTINIEHNACEEKQSNLQQTVDPANKEDIAKAIDAEARLTDEARSFSKGNKKATAPPSEE